MKLSYFILSASILSSSVLAKAITVKEFLDLYQNSDPEFKSLELSQKSLDYFIDEALPSRKTVLSISNENGYTSDSAQNTTVLSGEVLKEIIETGTQLSVSHTKTKRPDRAENVTEFRVEQSLYRNMFGRDVRLKKDALSLQRDLQKMQFTENYEQLLSDSLNQYLLLNKATNDLSLAQRIYEEANNLYKNISDKRKSQIASQTDVKRSRLLVLLRKQELITAKSTLATLKKQIEQTLGLDNFSLDSKQSNKLLNILLNNVNSHQKISYNRLRTHRILTLKEEVLQKEETLAGRLDSPQLDLIAGYNKDDSTRFSTRVQRDEKVVGLSLTVPFGDSQAKAVHQISKIDSKKASISKKINKLSVNKEIESIKAMLLESREQLKVDKEKVSLVKSILKDDEGRYRIGKIDLESLIEIKNNFATYRAQYEASKLKYAQIALDWLSITDQLIKFKEQI